MRQLASLARQAGILADQVAAQFANACGQAGGFTRFFIALQLDCLLRFAQLLAQAFVLFAQSGEQFQVGPRPAADLVLQHVDVAVDFLGQRSIACRMAPGCPECCADAGATVPGCEPSLAE